MTTTTAALLLIALWLLYFALHSLFASLWLKQRVASCWPQLMPGYRLAFNALALLLLLPPLYLTLFYRSPWLWQWQGVGWYIANGLALLAVAGFIWSMRYYSGDEFLGLYQWRRRITEVKDQEMLHISPLHRHVRHPWYFLGLVILWTRDMDLMLLITALMATGYLWFGSRLEERKLIRYYGEVYREYQRRVPALLPLPWRRLDAQSAHELERRARGE